ncbi:MAG: hypothetical protein ACR2MS_07500 [Weeksellaceae bacterium]
MKIYMLSLLFLIFGLVSCDFKKDEKIEDTAIPVTSDKDSEDNKKTVETAPETFKPLESWKGYYSDKVQGFDMSHFKKKESFDLVPHETTVKPIWSPEFNPVYKKFIKYNHDSTKYVDFMSYKLQFDQNNEVSISPDQEVVIVDVKNKKIESILFYGPSYWIEDAYFKNDSTLILLENSTDQVPAYQEINLNTLKSDYYTYDKKLDFSSSYLKDKLLSIYGDEF